MILPIYANHNYLYNAYNMPININSECNPMSIVLEKSENVTVSYP